MKFLISSIVIFTFSVHNAIPCLGQLDLVVDGGNYLIHCAVTPPLVKFVVTAKIIGWVGLGISRNPNMTNSDLFIGGISVNGGSPPFYNDYHGVRNGRPAIDDNSDWEIIPSECSLNETHTTMSFTRLLKTMDDSVPEQDVEIKDEDIFLIWAYGFMSGDSGDIPGYHGGARGSVLLNLYDQALVTEAPVDESSTISFITSTDSDGNETPTTPVDESSTISFITSTDSNSNATPTSPTVTFKVLAFLIVIHRLIYGLRIGNPHINS